MYYSAWAVITEYHRLSGFKKQKFIFLQFGIMDIQD